MISGNFRDWACSLSGCDGGNPDAEVWICGIEWGNASQDDGAYYREQLPEEINRGAVEPSGSGYDWNDSITYSFGRSFAKLYSTLCGADVSDYRNLATTKWTGSEVFKLNLYPIAFDSTSPHLWHEYGLDRLTGFSEKHLFQTWCLVNRFPAFSKIREEKKPKLIIGAGTSYLRDFFVCFGSNQDSCDRIEIGEIEPISDGNRGRTRRYYWARLDESTTLAVIPFFSGAYGLNSDYLLGEMGRRLADLCPGLSACK